jgi:hypothetical protein
VPPDFEEWCKPTEEVNVSIPDSLSSSSDSYSQNSSQEHNIPVEDVSDLKSDEIDRQITILRKSQLVIQRQIDTLAAESKHKRASLFLPDSTDRAAPPAPILLTT